MGSADATKLDLDVVDVPKRGGGVRAMTLLRPDDDARYRALVARMAPSIDAALHPGVAANRLASWDRPSAWAAERVLWRTRVASALEAEARPVVVLSDVRCCYASVREEAITTGLARAGLGGEDAAALLAFLAGCRRAGVEGLPTGPAPSAVLANAVLAVADDALVSQGVAFARWVDDVVIVAPGAGAAHRAWRAWERALREIGLHPHEAKTRLIAGREDAVRALFTSAPSLAPQTAVA